MKIIHYADAPAKIMESDAVKGVTARVLIGKGDQAPNFCMRLFTIAQGGFTPRHSHPWEHEMFVHAGEGEMWDGSSWNPMSPGTALFVPENAPHQMRNIGTAPLVVVCLIPSGPPEL
jgi:quercetin dioxygenase-like cupin family protein